MNWEAIAAIGQMLGAGGVIASVLFLASQVRHANRASAAAAKPAGTQMQTDFLDALISNPELMDLWNRGLKDLALLGAVERQRFKLMCDKAFVYHSASYFQFRNGTMDEDSWVQVRALWIHALGPGVQAWWKSTGRRHFGTSYVEYIDREMVEVEAERASRAASAAAHSPPNASEP